MLPPGEATHLRPWAKREGAPLSDPAPWPLTPTHRNAIVPDPIARALLAAARDGAEVTTRLVEPASDTAMQDRFALFDRAGPVARLPCAPD